MYDLLYYCPRAIACEHITNRYINRLLGDQKVGELSKKIDAVNPEGEATTGKDGPDIFEI
jgi:hypothetical protein